MEAFDPRYLKGPRGVLWPSNKLFEDHLHSVSFYQKVLNAALPQREKRGLGCFQVLTCSEQDCS